MATADETAPKIILIPLARSHPFNQRECTINEPLKVGRPVDKKRISSSNLIFDCRVLSRNHALIWYESGKFFIQDTKSSNGTFVNDCRLSPSGEESSPRELTTRDVVQFGVNVNVDKKVTHGCIIATIKLFVNGKELPGPDPDVQQVIQVVQHCLNKEQELETKLVSMQEAVNAAHILAKESMIDIVKEDELLSRLEMLENQLHVYSRKMGEDELRKQLAKALEEKQTNNISSKEKVRLILQEKIDCSTRLSQVQRDYDKAEEECQKYRTLYEALKQEHSQQMSKLTDQVKTVEKQKNELEEKAKKDKESALESQESLQRELDSTLKELESVQEKLSESNDRLAQARKEVEIATRRGYVADRDLEESIESLENAVGNFVHKAENTEIYTVMKHENTDSTIGNGDSEQEQSHERVSEEVLMTLTPSLDSQYEGGVAGSKSEGDNQELEVRLQSSERRVEELLGEINDLGETKKNLRARVEELNDQLASEHQEKASLLEKMESQSKQLSDLQLALNSSPSLTQDQETLGRSQDADDVRVYSSSQEKLSELKADVQRAERRSASLEELVKKRETELNTLSEEKSRLETRLTSLENQNSTLQEENRANQSKLNLKMTETQQENHAMKERISELQESLKKNSVDSLSSLTSLDPILSSYTPDPRIKVLSVITLASIAIALLSVTIAYFF